MSRLSVQDKRLLTSAAAFVGQIGELFVQGLFEAGVPAEEVHLLVTDQRRRFDRERMIAAAVHALVPKGFITLEVTAEDLDYTLPEGLAHSSLWREVEGPGRYTFYAKEFLREGEDTLAGEEMIRRAAGITGTYAQLRALARNFQEIPDDRGCC